MRAESQNGEVAAMAQKLERLQKEMSDLNSSLTQTKDDLAQRESEVR
jgi:predicted  nucleic acid-binding Zn-ribbon protein